MNPPDGPTVLEGLVTVSCETVERLGLFADLLRRWQKADNLVAPDTLPVLWRRHIADSAQLVRIAPKAKLWLDLGSGGGFPGLVVAILLADTPGASVTLVESNQRKGAFLRRVASETGAPAHVLTGRIEQVVETFDAPVKAVSARALAPLDRLLDLAQPVLARGATAYFHKGRDFQREIDEATKSWSFDLIKHKSLIDDSSVILEISRLWREAS